MEIESLYDKVENQIIVKRLFESDYDAKSIMKLEISGPTRSIVYKQMDKLMLRRDIG